MDLQSVLLTTDVLLRILPIGLICAGSSADHQSRVSQQQTDVKKTDIEHAPQRFLVEGDFRKHL